jgi:probable rRNA maturation factor
MIEVEVFDAASEAQSPSDRVGGGARGLGSPACAAPTFAEVRRLCVLAAASAGVQDGHLAIEFVDAERITQLNWTHRRRLTPTDVLSFPVDGVEPIGETESPGASFLLAGERTSLGLTAAGSRELGDVLICPEHTTDLREAIVHGVLHLVGMDHETDDGEMLALQHELLASEGR